MSQTPSRWVPLSRMLMSWYPSWGLLRGTPQQFERTQWRGAENIAKTASDVGAKVIHFSAIGAGINSTVSYWREGCFISLSRRHHLSPEHRVWTGRRLLLGKFHQCSGSQDYEVHLEVPETHQLGKCPSSHASIWRGNYSFSAGVRR